MMEPVNNPDLIRHSI